MHLMLSSFLSSLTLNSKLFVYCPFGFLEPECRESLDQTDQMFKPGWKDIFRMNQNELESEIRKVSRDPTLDPRRKAYLIQNLMTRFALLISDYIFFEFIFLNFL